MDESLTQEILNFIENKIERFENEKFLEKGENRNLGIIYTPKEVVDYIVSNIFRIRLEEILNYQNETQRDLNLEGILLSLTKNQKIKGNIAKKIKSIRILDPSCGSGRFLMSIAEKLYQIHRILNPELSEFDIKKAIIQNNLYGIEIENSAYYISKLRLIRWLLSTNPEHTIFHNINLKSLKLTTFDQIIEKLSPIFNIFNLDFLLEFNSDKFDIIIGNPPYVENKKIKDIEFKKELTKRYKTAYRLFDLSILFIEKSLELLEDGGYISFILPNKFLSADYGIKVRKLILNESEIREIINISSLPIFQNTATYPIIISLKKTRQSQNQEIEIKILNNMNELIENSRIKTIKFHQDLIKKFPSNVIPISGNIKLITYLFNNFKTFAETCQDLRIIYRPFGFLKYSKYFDNTSDERQSDDDLLLIGTGNIEKYHIKFNKRIKIAGKDIKISYFNYNTNFEQIWSDLNSEKLIFREIAKNLTCCYDPGIFTNVTGLYFIKIASFKTDQLFSLLTILNSNLMDLVFKTLFGTLHMAGGYLRFNGSFIKRLPLPGKFPLFLSQLGKIIHLLSQLKYDLDSKESEFVRNPEIERFNNKYYNQILCYLKFFKRLSNSLVNLLFLDDFYLESNLDYYLLRNLFDLKIEPQKVPYKFLIPRFDINNYNTFSLNELNSILTKIKKLYSRLHNDTSLINQIDDQMKTNFS
ncbi:MAG: Eco57I restriction-modification methylase domain-containing protein [Candidatus Lokiarchaeota archaeon]|nr:Eco57I restriction-modification methylase domain-containing protein [Candidatus Lokiarchaeota archaeon]